MESNIDNGRLRRRRSSQRWRSSDWIKLHAIGEPRRAPRKKTSKIVTGLFGVRIDYNAL